MKKKESITNERLLPFVTPACIESQRDANKRVSRRTSLMQARKYITRENPHLLKFLLDSAHEIFNDDFLPEPVAAHFRELLIQQFGLAYNILRAQIEADQMDIIWPSDNTTP